MPTYPKNATPFGNLRQEYSLHTVTYVYIYISINTLQPILNPAPYAPPQTHNTNLEAFKRKLDKANVKEQDGFAKCFTFLSLPHTLCIFKFNIQSCTYDRLRRYLIQHYYQYMMMAQGEQQQEEEREGQEEEEEDQEAQIHTYTHTYFTTIHKSHHDNILPLVLLSATATKITRKRKADKYRSPKCIHRVFIPNGSIGVPRSMVGIISQLCTVCMYICRCMRMWCRWIERFGEYGVWRDGGKKRGEGEGMRKFRIVEDGALHALSLSFLWIYTRKPGFERICDRWRKE